MLNSFINDLYANNQVEDLEKTAERAFLDELGTSGQVAQERPLQDIPLEELIKMAQTGGQVEEPVYEDEDEQEKLAADIMGGELMAHAMIHEMVLIKEAVANGLCRVCKANPMDIQGSSVCSACGQ